MRRAEENRMMVREGWGGRRGGGGGGLASKASKFGASGKYTEMVVKDSTEVISNFLYFGFEGIVNILDPNVSRGICTEGRYMRREQKVNTRQVVWLVSAQVANRQAGASTNSRSRCKSTQPVMQCNCATMREQSYDGVAIVFDGKTFTRMVRRDGERGGKGRELCCASSFVGSQTDIIGTGYIQEMILYVKVSRENKVTFFDFSSCLRENLVFKIL
ncbi:hypothetical protein M0804_003137 [Polistes exclamans]|nr:hypothetical protein M0804_003137 [Polistes exclamans]